MRGNSEGKSAEAWRFREERETTDMARLHGSLKFAAKRLGGGSAKLLRYLVDLIGIEPMTSSMPWKRAPSCATGPLQGGTCLFSAKPRLKSNPERQLGPHGIARLAPNRSRLIHNSHYRKFAFSPVFIGPGTFLIAPVSIGCRVSEHSDRRRSLFFF